MERTPLAARFKELEDEHAASSSELMNACFTFKLIQDQGALETKIAYLAARFGILRESSELNRVELESLEAELHALRNEVYRHVELLDDSSLEDKASLMLIKDRAKSLISSFVSFKTAREEEINKVLEKQSV
jgi:hypothetical protein